MSVRRFLVAVPLVGAVVFAVLWYFFLRETGDPRLAGYVTGRPPFPVVFTSRSETSSFRAAASNGDYEGAALQGNGQPQWQAQEGRLRILTPSGQVRELTWDKNLSDGAGSVMDVMSPSVSADAKTVVFAGRRSKVDGGRFRIYSVSVHGGEIQQLTGGATDPGCVAVPPLRFAAEGTKLLDAETRKQIDYDDVDPVLLPNGSLIFASSRIPDLGGRNRRATQLWIREENKAPRPLTASRANDRWPMIAQDYFLLFSIWSKQDEVVSADGTGLTRTTPPTAGLTAPTDRWMSARVSPSGEQFAVGVKLPEPVWRPRFLFDGTVAFMTPVPGSPTPFTANNEHPEKGPLRVAHSVLGQVSSAPSSLAAGSTFPEQAEPRIYWAPATTADGSKWSLATPSPLPTDRVLVSASRLDATGSPYASGYGLYTMPQTGWSADPNSSGELTLLFDDPELVDAEPVAVYPRPVDDGPIRLPQAWDSSLQKSFQLATGPYTGPAGDLSARQLTTAATGAIPGNIATGGKSPIIPIYPAGSIEKIVFYAAHRDRFDDPVQPVVRGKFELLHETKTTNDGGFHTMMPVGSPTLLIGVGPDGKVVSALGAPDEKGNRGRFYAFAGDHVSGTRSGAAHFCTGCHTGHTFPGPVLPERIK